ncbi:MAG: NAD-dependent epimerase/dehydratase family protein [Reyranella sp.]|nr:NAD-dependent epimerase/dehydratase family protein [Reyranella sp.]MBL6650066.1 NAD-dependent epimerase/dehydratase family protein [Reyranella sp.]
MTARYIVVGGAGFIGSHFVDRLLGDRSTAAVTVFDNFSSGRRWHLEGHAGDNRLSIVEGDVKDLEALTRAMGGHDTAIHLASNPDIAKAATQPDVDFYEGTFLTHQVVEAMRRSGVKTILYASGSGVYGDLGEVEANEQHAVGEPISTYGASKLAGEALISAYCFMFGLRGRAFRFGNVVGPHQTHGVGFDFVRRLLQDPSQLSILGDGRQSKSYIHIDDVIEAVLTAHKHDGAAYNVFNVATGDYITVTEIAELAVECVGLRPGSVKFSYTGGDRGWKGDVPIIRLATERIRGIGWKCKRSSREALRAAMLTMVGEFRAGRM